MLRNLDKLILEKESHKNKALSRHIEECKRLVYDFINFYGLEKQYKTFTDELCYYHDLGKLRPDFDVNKKENPSHSPYSLYIFLKKKKIDGDQRTFLPWFILKHHGMLTRGIDELKISGSIPSELPNTEREWFEEEILIYRRHFYYRVPQISIDERINLCDIFGLFKFADILSANNMVEYKLSLPNKSSEDLENWLFGKITKKGLKIRKETLKTQLDLNNVKGNLLLRAPTGWGKTAASLSYALGKSSKIIYILPTISSIKSFYGDVCDFFGRENVGELFYYGDVEALKREEDFQEIMFSSYFVRPVIITTLDQLLLTFLQLGKYFLKRPHIRNSVMIFDEVHTFTPNMLHIISFFIKRYIRPYKLKFCVMSATFPSVLKKFFVNLLRKDVDMLWLDNEFKRRRRIMFLRKKENRKDADILDLTSEVVALFKSKKKPFRMAIVCNTVKKAQKVFKNLQNSEKIPIKAELLHAKFIYKHRSKKEEKIQEWIRTRQSFILVATQVIEVSLDVSFDFMITECAPLESLVQRFGRVNRYEERTEETNVWITFPTEINAQERYPYDSRDILKTWDFLENLEGNKLKNELQLIDEYDKIACIGSSQEIINLLEAWEDHTYLTYSWRASEELAQKLLRFREEFNVIVIPKIYEEEVGKLYREMERNGISYLKRKETFAKIKEYTVPVPIWIVKTRPVGGFPIVEINYDEIYGVSKSNDHYEVAIL